jgi:hypothetical protein
MNPYIETDMETGIQYWRWSCYEDVFNGLQDNRKERVRTAEKHIREDIASRGERFRKGLEAHMVNAERKARVWQATAEGDLRILFTWGHVNGKTVVAYQRLCNHKKISRRHG